MAARPLGFFDQEIRQRKLQALGDPLVALNTIVPWTIFSTTLESMRSEGCDPRKGGRPPHDTVRMFKVLVLRELYALSDERVEYHSPDLPPHCGQGWTHARGAQGTARTARP